MVLSTDQLLRELISAGLSPRAARILMGALTRGTGLDSPVDSGRERFYAKLPYPTTARIAYLLEDFQEGAGTPEEIASYAPDGTVTTSLFVDESAAVVIDDVAYWPAGYPRYHYLDADGHQLSQNGGNYATGMLRFDLETDKFLDPVQIPAPAGAPAPTMTSLFTYGAHNPDVHSYSSGTVHTLLVSNTIFADITIYAGAALPKFGGRDVVLLNSGDFSWDYATWPPTGSQVAASSLEATTSQVTLPSSYGVNFVVRMASAEETLDATAFLAYLEGLRVAPAIAAGGNFGLATQAGWGFEGGFVGTIGGKVYFGGGDSNLFDNGTGSADAAGAKPWDQGHGRQIMSYDPATGQFATLAVKPFGVDYSCYGVADDKLYVLGDHSGHTVLDVYNPQSNTWASHDLTSIASGIAGMSIEGHQAVQAGRFLYFGGNGFKLDLDADATQAGAWIQVGVMPGSPRGANGNTVDAFASVVGAFATGPDGLLHYFTGQGANNEGDTWKVHLALDPDTDRWVDMADQVWVPRNFFSAVLNPNNDWRFIGGGSYVAGEVHTQIDTLVTNELVLQPAVRALEAKVENAGASFTVGVCADTSAAPVWTTTAVLMPISATERRGELIDHFVADTYLEFNFNGQVHTADGFDCRIYPLDVEDDARLFAEFSVQPNGLPLLGHLRAIHEGGVMAAYIANPLRQGGSSAYDALWDTTSWRLHIRHTGVYKLVFSETNYVAL